MSTQENNALFVHEGCNIPESIPSNITRIYWVVSNPLPELPEGLEYLQCNLVTELPKLPDRLVELWCKSVIVLPEVLPEGLEEITYNNGQKWHKVSKNSEEINSTTQVDIEEFYSRSFIALSNNIHALAEVFLGEIAKIPVVE